MFIIMINYKKPIEVVEQHVTEHRSFIEQCMHDHYFVAAGPKVPRTGGVIISQMTNRDQLSALLEQDPFFIHDIADFEITEFIPVKHHEDFASFISE